jgi:hypothetical protein
VKGIYLNRDYVHYVSGKYVTPTNFEVIQLRKNRGNGCVTKMKIRASVKSSDQYTFDWIALDSNCDLAKGRTGAGTCNRQGAVEQKLWY